MVVRKQMWGVVSAWVLWALLPGALVTSDESFAAKTVADAKPGADLSGADFSGADLSSLDLTGANLTEANLRGAKLHRTRLRGSILKGVKSGGITGTPAGTPTALPQGWFLRGGYLLGPDANLEGEDLRGLDLEGVDLRHANLNKVVSGGITGKPLALPGGVVLDNGFLVTSGYDRAITIFKRVAHVNPTKAELEKMLEHLSNPNLSQQERLQKAVEVAMNSKEFYTTSLVRLFAPSTNRYKDPNVPLNDAIALNIGLVRDGIPYNEVLFGNHYYVANEANADLTFPGKATNADKSSGGIYRGRNHLQWRPWNNVSYENLQKWGFDLRRPDVLMKVDPTQYIWNSSWRHTDGQDFNIFKTSSVVDGALQESVAAPDIAGVITTRAMAESFLLEGTNRRIIRFLLSEYLCHDLEELKDTTAPDNFIRKDVDRNPGGNPALFQSSCKGCHSIMDSLAGAFAYANFQGGDLSFTYKRTGPNLVCSKMPQCKNEDPAEFLEAPRCLSEALRTVSSVNLINSSLETGVGQESRVSLKAMVGSQPMGDPELYTEVLMSSGDMAQKAMMERLAAKINSGKFSSVLVAEVSSSVPDQWGYFLVIKARVPGNTFVYNYENMAGPEELRICPTSTVKSGWASAIRGAVSPSVHSKMTRNSHIYPDGGFVPHDDSWESFLGVSATKPDILGWGEAPRSGRGMKSLGRALSATKAFGTCQVKRVFRHVCLREPTKTELQKIALIGDNFIKDYQFKNLFAPVVGLCL